MSDGIKAYEEDLESFNDNMRAVDLYDDLKYKNIPLYSQDSYIVNRCAREHKSRNETIKEIIFARHAREAQKEYDTEMKERNELSQLMIKYGK